MTYHTSPAISKTRAQRLDLFAATGGMRYGREPGSLRASTLFLRGVAVDTRAWDPGRP